MIALKNRNLLNNETYNKLMLSSSISDSTQIYYSIINSASKFNNHGIFQSALSEKNDSLTHTGIEDENNYSNSESNIDIDRDMKENIKMLLNHSIHAYELLGVPNNATPTEIKKAYYEKARTHHPDKNKNTDQELFKYLNMAYKVLSDTEGRKVYDRGLNNLDVRQKNSDRPRLG